MRLGKIEVVFYILLELFEENFKNIDCWVLLLVILV